MAWPLTGSPLAKYNRLLSDLRQYGTFYFIGSPDDITFLWEIIRSASDGALSPELDDVANRPVFWMLTLATFLGDQIVALAPSTPCPDCPPVVPCPDPRVTTTPSGLEDEFGIFSFFDIPGLTEVVIHGTNIGGGVDIENQTDLISVSAPDLVTMDEVQFVLRDNSALTSVSLPVLTTVDNVSFIDVGNTALLTSFSLPALVTLAGSSVIQANNSTALTAVSLGNVIFENGTSITFFGDALTAASVNHILARGVASALFTIGLIELSGGTSSAPTGQGIADKATLIARGVTVSTN